jgi:predicted RNA-binding Zn-ribbon protein involved in translation (DUF1610 family)
MNEVGNHNGRVCPICSNGYATLTNHATRDASKVDCPQCGNFIISRSAIINLGNGDDTNRWKVSAWINEFWPPLVTSGDVDLALASTVPSLHHRADRMLRAIAAKFNLERSLR